MAEEKQPKADFKHLVRVANTDLKGEKPILYAMRKIKGVSIMLANAVLRIAKVDPKIRAGDLKDDQVKKIDSLVSDLAKAGIPSWMLNRRKDYESGEDKHLLIADLKFQKENDVKRLKKIKSYRGFRHQSGLPVRGQRTRSNFRRRRGKGSLGVKRKK